MSSFRKRYLLTPGPTMIPPEVMVARAKPIPHHRTPQFQALLKESHEKLKTIFKTKNEVLSLSTSGSGAMEAVVASLLSPGDQAICVDGGKFGNRWVELCSTYNIEPVTITIPRGEAVTAEQLGTTLKKYPKAKVVLTQLTETSTGVTYDLQALGKVVSKTQTVLVVDAISAIAAETFYPDDWGVDVVIGASQKALMLPPGLSFVSLSPKAWSLAEKARCPRYYLDLKRYAGGGSDGESPFTPAISLYIELGEVVKMIEAETIEGMWKRHAWLAQATRAGITALGLELFAKRPSNVLTAVKVPNGIRGDKLVGMMRDDFGVTIAGGQSELKGKIFRIAHLGYVDRFDIITAMAALEMAFKRLGYPVAIGRGVKAAEELLIDDPQ